MRRLIAMVTVLIVVAPPAAQAQNRDTAAQRSSSVQPVSPEAVRLFRQLLHTDGQVQRVTSPTRTASGQRRLAPLSAAPRAGHSLAGLSPDSPGGQQTPVLHADEIVVSVDSAAPRPEAQPGEDHLDLSIRGLTLDGAGQLHQFQVIVEPGAGLNYATDARSFRGKIFIGLEDVDHPGQHVWLGAPLQLQLFGPDSVEPGTLSLDHTDVPLVPVALEAFAPTDSLRVRVRPQGNAAAQFGIPVRRIPLEVRASATRVDGLGLDVVTLTVPFPGEFSGDSLQVSLAAGATTPEPAVLQLRRGETGVAKLRSKGLGPVVVSATGPFFTSPATADVEFAWPIGFLLAALLGGTLGAAGREAVRRNAETSFRRLARHAVAGLIAGIFVAVAYAIGLNLLAVDIGGPPVEAVVFFVAGAGAIGGIALLVRGVPGIERALRRG